MKIKSNIRNYILIGLSASVMMGCLVLIKLYGRNIGVIILLVIALLIFGKSADNVLKGYDDIEGKKKIDIEMKDERNTFIREKAGAKTNYIMLILNTCTLYVLAFMNAELWTICLFGALIFLQGIISILTYNYYSKRY